MAVELAAVLVAAVVVLAVAGRRSGERSPLLWIPAGMERVTRIPGWAHTALLPCICSLRLSWRRRPEPLAVRRPAPPVEFPSPTRAHKESAGYRDQRKC